MRERRNLLAIATRMTSLVTERPRTLLEAAQLIFTLHACLHLIGEPTAIGRLDQMLYPFYEKDLAAGHLDAEQAQEIIDCFWLKLGEKVQLNRQFVEDHPLDVRQAGRWAALRVRHHERRVPLAPLVRVHR